MEKIQILESDTASNGTWNTIEVILQVNWEMILAQ